MTKDDLNQIDEILQKRLTESESRVMGEIGKFMEDHLFPALEQKADKSDMDKLQSSIDLFGDRVSKIESIPTI